LKIELDKGDQKSNLYATKKDHFFMKVRPVEIEFTKNVSGKVEKMIAYEGGIRYDIKKTR